MDGEKRFYQQSWFYPGSWTVFCLIIYVWQIFRLGGLQASLVYLVVDALIFGIGMVVWLAFFAQFILPVSHFRERQKIFDRLTAHLAGGHGPAIFVKDGVPILRKDEEKKKEPGVMWLDSASALQLRATTKFTRAIGPGVHFTENGEYIAGVVDLHTQSQGLGPFAKDKPFDPKPESISQEEYDAIQRRRNETSGLTRDGIEVVPNVNVSFKIDAEPVEGEGPGSRFADLKPTVGKDGKIIEEASPVFKAIAGEGINPNLLDKPPEKQLVAWNRLPALIAADLWREYISKFTLRDLFTPDFEIPPDKPAPLQPALHETTALYEPITASTPRNAWQDSIAEIVHEINHLLLGWITNLEKETAAPPPKPKAPSAPPPAGGGTVRKGTALEVINAMIKARMTQERVEELDASGRRTGREIESPEYKLLKSRGLKVMSGSAGSLRFTPTVEDQLVRQWSATWLNNAKAERDAIDRRRKQIELQGQEKSLREFTHNLSRSLLRARPVGGVDTIKYLITRTRDELIRQDRLYRRLSTEISELDDILTWLEQ